MAVINYERQRELGLTIPGSVAVVGVGGVGSWTALLLAMSGVPKLWLFDKDTLSDHNLNRIPVPPSVIEDDEGNPVQKLKTQAVAETIRMFRPDCEVLALGVFAPETAELLELGSNIDWIVATTDTLASRRMVSDWAASNDIDYIEAAAEGEIGSATGEPAGWSTEAENQPGYASVPVWAGPCLSSSLLAVTHILHNRHMNDRTIRFGWDKETDDMSIVDTGKRSAAANG